MGPTFGAGVGRPGGLPPHERVPASNAREVHDVSNERTAGAAATWGDSLSSYQWCVYLFAGRVWVFMGVQGVQEGIAERSGPLAPGWRCFLRALWLTQAKPS